MGSESGLEIWMEKKEKSIFFFFPLKNELEWQGKDLNMSQPLNLPTLISRRKSSRGTILGQRAEKKKARKG